MKTIRYPQFILVGFLIGLIIVGAKAYFKADPRDTEHNQILVCSYLDEDLNVQRTRTGSSFFFHGYLVTAGHGVREIEGLTRVCFQDGVQVDVVKEVFDDRYSAGEGLDIALLEQPHLFVDELEPVDNQPDEREQLTLHGVFPFQETVVKTTIHGHVRSIHPIVQGGEVSIMLVDIQEGEGGFGFSGGPVMDMRGRLVGMTIGGDEEKNLASVLVLPEIRDFILE